PYRITSNLIIDENATLKINPGVNIFIRAWRDDEYPDSNPPYVISEDPYFAKYIICEGNIIARGTSESPVSFLSDTPDSEDRICRWGSVIIRETCRTAEFQYCNIDHSGGLFENGGAYMGGITCFNDALIIRNCNFSSNITAFEVLSNAENGRYEVSETTSSQLYDYDHSSFAEEAYALHFKFSCNPVGSRVSITGCTFTDNIIKITGVCYSYPNQFMLNVNELVFSDNEWRSENCDYPRFYNLNDYEDNISFFYNNKIDTLMTWAVEGDSYYSGNEFSFFENGIYALGSVSLSDNNFTKTSVFARDLLYSAGNKFKLSDLVVDNRDFSGRENIIDSTQFSLGRTESNKIFMSNDILFSDTKCDTIYNSILLDFESFSFDHSSEIVFKNCLLDSDFGNSGSYIDGGGNIFIGPDSTYLDSVFVNFAEGDFRPCPGSPLIDAGFNGGVNNAATRFGKTSRIFDGDNDGEAVVDIGPYEYGAESSGVIRGVTYDVSNGNRLPYALIYPVDSKEFYVVSDENGDFEFYLPPGVYDIFGSRIFFRDYLYEDIVVENDTEVQLYFWLEPLYPDMTPDNAEEFNGNTLVVYPNPFTPDKERQSVSVKFDLSSSGFCSLSVYNVKGQKIRDILHDNLPEGEHVFSWNGKNNANSAVASGVYFVRLKTSGETLNRKILML
ncbi:MAG: hypothetical protein CSB55_09195, partial [Candidatus Cloacimonadota bacterium]